MRIAWKLRLNGILLFAGLALFAAADDSKGWVVPPEAKAAINPLAATPAVLAAGRALYDDKCVSCHGDKGKGDGPESEMYDTPPADLTKPGLLDGMSDGELFWKITQGRRPMPSFRKQYTDEQRWQLVHFIRTFAPAPEKPAKPAPAKSPAKKSPAKNPQ